MQIACSVAKVVASRKSSGGTKNNVQWSSREAEATAVSEAAATAATAVTACERACVCVLLASEYKGFKCRLQSAASLSWIEG